MVLIIGSQVKRVQKLPQRDNWPELSAATICWLALVFNWPAPIISQHHYLPAMCLSWWGCKLCEGGDSCSSAYSQGLARCRCFKAVELNYEKPCLQKPHGLLTPPSWQNCEALSEKNPQHPWGWDYNNLSENVQEQSKGNPINLWIFLWKYFSSKFLATSGMWGQ